MNKNNIITPFLCVYLTIQLFSNPSVTQAADESTPIVVTATRTAQVADQALTPTIVITQQDIELSQSRDVAEILRFHAGIDLARSGGPGQQTSLFVRGTESDHVIIMIDGVKMNARTVSTAAIQNINPDLIERVEIVKGPRSSLYGSEGIGGVVNIITKKSNISDDALQVTLGAGNENTNQVALGYHKQINRTRVGIDAKYFETDGFPTLTASTIDRGFENSTLNAYVDTKAGNTDIGFSIFTAQGTTEYLVDPTTPADQDFSNSVGAFSLETPISSFGTAKLKLSHMLDENTQNQNDDKAKTTRQAADFQTDFGIGNHNLLTAGLYYADEKVDYLSFGLSVPDNGKNNTVKAIYVQDDFQYGAHHVVAAVRYSDDDNFGDNTTYNIDYGYAINQRLRLLAGVGTGFRAPTHIERFGWGGNVNLKAETSQNFELGSRMKIDDHQSVSVSLFHNEIDDLITADPSFVLQNIDQTLIRGIELGYKLRAQNWNTYVELIFQDPRNETTGETLLRRAKRSLTSGIQYHSGSDRFGVDLLATSSRKDFFWNGTASVPVELAAYAIVNLNYQHRFNKQWRIKSHIENLFNKEYELIAGYNTQDRFLMIELVYND